MREGTVTMDGRHQHVLLQKAHHTDPVAAWAEGLYRRAGGGTWWQQIGNLLLRGSERLLNLDDVLHDRPVIAVYDGGLRYVPLPQIRGSESPGRCADFDAAFRPLRDHLKERWVRVARAWHRGVVLPPVTLIQFDGNYFVRDGHHRISVARAVGQESILAHVTVRKVGKLFRPSR